MAKIPSKPTRPAGSVRSSIAGGGAAGDHLGKVRRITNDARDAEAGHAPRRRRRRSSRSGQRREMENRQSAVLKRWLVLILLVAGGSVAFMVVSVVVDLRHSAINPVEKPPATSAFRAPALPAPEAVAMISGVLAANTPEQLAPLIRSSGMEPTTAFEGLQGLKAKYDGLGDPVWLGSLDSLLQPVEVVAVPKGSLPGTPLVVCLTPEQEEWRVDIDALLGVCDPAFEMFVEEKADAGMVRAEALRDTYFNGRFDDEDDWICLTLRHPDSEHVIYGYARKGTPQDEAIRAIERRNRLADARGDRAAGDHLGGRRMMRATFRLKRPDDALHRQYEIVSVLADDWVLAQHPLDEILVTR